MNRAGKLCSSSGEEFTASTGHWQTEQVPCPLTAPSKPPPPPLVPVQPTALRGTIAGTGAEGQGHMDEELWESSSFWERNLYQRLCPHPPRALLSALRARDRCLPLCPADEPPQRLPTPETPRGPGTGLNAPFTPLLCFPSRRAGGGADGAAHSPGPAAEPLPAAVLGQVGRGRSGARSCKVRGGGSSAGRLRGPGAAFNGAGGAGGGGNGRRAPARPRGSAGGWSREGGDVLGAEASAGSRLPRRRGSAPGRCPAGGGEMRHGTGRGRAVAALPRQELSGQGLP